MDLGLAAPAPACALHVLDTESGGQDTSTLGDVEDGEDSVTVITEVDSLDGDQLSADTVQTVEAE